MTTPAKVLVDGITHYLKRDTLACGKRVYDRRLQVVFKMFCDGELREVDCMACIVKTLVQ